MRYESGHFNVTTDEQEGGDYFDDVEWSHTATTITASFTGIQGPNFYRIEVLDPLTETLIESSVPIGRESDSFAALECTIDGLTPNTTYHVMLVGSDDAFPGGGP